MTMFRLLFRLLFKLLLVLSISISAFATDTTSRSLQFDTTITRNIIFADRSKVEPILHEHLLKERLACLEEEIPLTYHASVKKYILLLLEKRRSMLTNVLNRIPLYFPMFEKVFSEKELPDELKYLSIIESSLVSSARSHMGAVGLWQFMPYTGGIYGLKQSYYTDDRMDPYKATLAAAKYLQKMYHQYGDWQLAMASYNCGPGNINKAMRRSGSSYFFGMYRYLPKETRGYVPQYIALRYILNHADEFNLTPDYASFNMPVSKVLVYKSISLTLLAKHLGMCLNDLKVINPRLKYNIVPVHKDGFEVFIPKSKEAYFLAHKASIIEKSRYKGKVQKDYAYGDFYYHRVRRGENLSTIAEKNRVGLSSLRRWNNIYHNRIYPGQKLKIYSSAKNKKFAPKKKTHKQTHMKNQEGYYTVASGDSLWKIAQQFSVSVEKLKKVNRLYSNRIDVGQKLKVQF